MDSAAKTSAGDASVAPPPDMPPALSRAYRLRAEGDPSGAAAELESALEEMRRAPEADHKSRVTLVMTLADFYQQDGALEKARGVLESEVAFAEEEFARAKAGGTLQQKRDAATAITLLRDQLARVSLIGRTAPEISVKEWVNGDPLTLASSRGSVVLIDFWATWCKPCAAALPNIKRLHEEYAGRGLRVIGLTRHYFADRATADSQAGETELVRKYVRDHGVEFPVGIAEDAATQTLYGASGMPTLVLIDRKGLVRGFGHFGDEASDPQLIELLRRCLEEKA